MDNAIDQVRVQAVHIKVVKVEKKGFPVNGFRKFTIPKVTIERPSGMGSGLPSRLPGLVHHEAIEKLSVDQADRLGCGSTGRGDMKGSGRGSRWGTVDLQPPLKG